MTYALLSLAACICAYRMVRSARLLSVTLWLAATSALLAVLIYALGAPEVAVIELSVGAGLVTVLFVFAFSVVGELTLDALTRVPRPLAWGLALAAAGLLAWFLLPLTRTAAAPTETAGFGETLWQARGLDVLVQIVLIFSGVLGVLGLVSEGAPEQPGALAGEKPVFQVPEAPEKPAAVEGTNGNGRHAAEPAVSREVQG